MESSEQRPMQWEVMSGGGHDLITGRRTVQWRDGGRKGGGRVGGEEGGGEEGRREGRRGGRRGGGEVGRWGVWEARTGSRIGKGSD